MRLPNLAFWKRETKAAPVHPRTGAGLFWSGSPGSNANWEREAGNLWDSSIVAGAINWIARVFPEAPPILAKPGTDPETGKRKDAILYDHEFLSLLEAPNAFDTLDEMWQASILSLLCDGNAYWRKERNAAGTVLGLWYTPHWLMEPKWDEHGKAYLTHYEYRPGIEKFAMRPEDVVHLRYGKDPQNIRKGLSPLKAVLREVATENAAGNFAAWAVKRGQKGLLIAPKGPDVSWTPEEGAAYKQSIIEKTSGDNAGAPLVMLSDTTVSEYGFSPTDVDLRSIRETDEARILGVIGLHPQVFATLMGLTNSTENNVTQAKRSAYQSCIQPLKTSMGRQLKRQLLPDFEEDITIRVDWDYSQVAALQDDKGDLYNALTTAAGGPILTADEARAEVDRAPLGGDAAKLREKEPAIAPGQEPGGKPKPSKAYEDWKAGAIDHATYLKLSGYDDVDGIIERLRSQDVIPYQPQ